MSPVDLPESDPNPPPQFDPLLQRLLVLNWVNILLSLIYFIYMMRAIRPDVALNQVQYAMLVAWCVLLFGLGGYAFVLCLIVVLRGTLTERIVAPFFTLLSLPGLTMSPMVLVHLLTL